MTRAWKESNKDRHREQQRKATRKYIDNPDNWVKLEARRLLAWALKHGRVIKGKCHCGDVNVEAHHEDYDRPFDVQWLCKKHHTERSSEHE